MAKLFDKHVDYTAYDLDWLQRQVLTGRSNILEPDSDPVSAGIIQLLDLSVTSRLVHGRIVDAVPYIGWYKVLLENGNAPTACCRLSDCSGVPFGVRQVGQLQPNTRVLVSLHQSNQYGVIIGSIPHVNADPALVLSDWLSQGANVSFKLTPANTALLETMARHGGLVDFSNGRPLDTTTIGEWGYMADTGVGILIDPYMAHLRVDEECGLYLFYWDQMTRLTGHNLELRSAGWWMQSLDDQIETNIIDASSPYYWETLGIFHNAPGVQSTQTDQQVHLNKPWYAKIEPANFAEQQPYHRLLHYRGYLGQGGKRQLSAPPTGAIQGPQGTSCEAPPDGALNLYPSLTIFPGLFEEQVSLTGHYGMRSAKGVSIAKRPLIPIPKQIQLPESALGDTPDNYKFAGSRGAGNDHNVKDFTTPPMYPQLTTAAGVLDMHAYIYNWEGLHPFAYHTLDWYTPEESELTHISSNATPLSLGALVANPYMQPPASESVIIDHRYGPVKYYPTYSYIELTDDGGVLIGDGYGSEIRMTGGSIHITAPGDVWMQPGKNFNCWAGWDAVIRSQNSVDISASNRDVRIKAEYNMQLVAGNSGTYGGILLESRATCFGMHDYTQDGEDVLSSGIVLKAAGGQVITYAAQVYIRTGGGDIAKGDIVLDANKGDGNIRTISCDFDRFSKGYYRDFFGASPTRVNVFSSDGTILGGQLAVAGPGQFCGDLEVRGAVGATGHFGSPAGFSTDAIGRLVKGWLPPTPDCPAFAALAAELVQGADTYTTEIADMFYASTKVGEDDTQEHIKFAYRTVPQYHTDNFILFESRWQQLARLQGAGTVPWSEKAVVGPGGNPTYPHPGEQKWLTDPVFHELDLTLFAASTGHSVNRGTGLSYQNPAYAVPATQALEGRYPVIM